MAASGSQTIQLYYSTTSGAAPSAGNLTSGEFAVNITDGKLYYKDNAGAVQVLATKGTGAIGGSNTQVQYNNNGSLAGSGNLLFDGTTLTTNALSLTNALTVGNGGTGATTLTGYVKGNGTSAMTASSTIPNTDISGLGTMSTQNANSVAITGGTVNGTSIGATTASTGSFTSLTDSGNLTFTGTGNRITGDFSNATAVNRVMFQTSTANTTTIIGAIPSGTGTQSNLHLHSSSDPDNSSFAQLFGAATEVRLAANKTGTGSYLPMTFYTGGSERVRIDTSGNVGIGTSSPGTKLDAYNSGTASTIVRVRNDSSSVYLDANNGYTYLNTFSNHPMLFGTNNAERMRINAIGNVGVGTSNADQGKLTVFNANNGNPATSGSSDPNIITRIASGAIALDTGIFASGRAWIQNRIANDYANNYDLVLQPNGGNVGIGTSSPDQRLDVARAVNANNDARATIFATDTTSFAAGVGGGISFRAKYNTAGAYFEAGNIKGIKENGTDGNFAGALVFSTHPSGNSPAERMRIDSSGNVGIGTTATSGNKFIIQGTSGTPQFVAGTSANNWAINIFDSATAYLTAGGTNINSVGFGAASNIPLFFMTNNTERARIDTSGNLLVGTTSADGKFVASTASTTQRTVHASSGSGSTTTDGVYYAYVNQARGTGFNFMRFQNTSAIDFQVLGNGNVQNTNNSYGAISDARLKENIVDATPKLEKLKQVRVVNYNFKGAEQKQLGVIAQELEQIFPSMVEETPDRDAEGNHLGTTTKSVKYSVFVPMLIKAMQEQQAQIEELRAEIKTLKGN